MSIDFLLIAAIVIGVGGSFFLLYTRKKKWMDPTWRWLLATILLFIALFGMSTTKNPEPGPMILYWWLTGPFVYQLFDFVFKNLSYKMHQRDLLLWLRHSDDISDSIFAKNSHVKTSDKVFSMSLLLIVIGWPVLGIMLFRP